MLEIILGLALISVAWGAVSAIAIASFLSKKGHKIIFLFFRILILKYIHQYAEITKNETGKRGGWFYSYIISMNLALIFAIIGLILK
ncbi:MAG: hypothetical protein KAS29_14280 [Bacteroidales bacterium]|nr:hypothetical protein [Bacteroidales bacterium]